MIKNLFVKSLILPLAPYTVYEKEKEQGEFYNLHLAKNPIYYIAQKIHTQNSITRNIPPTKTISGFRTGNKMD